MHLQPATERLAPEPLAHPTLAGLQAWPVANRVGESPAWHAGDESLLWIDVRAPALLRLHPASGHLTRWTLPEVVGALALQGSHKVWLALRQRLVRLDLRSGRLEDIARIAHAPEANRLNDGKASPTGRWFVFGAMDDRPQRAPHGGLYCAGLDGTVRQLADDLCVANGIAFSPDGRTLYHSDSHRGIVWHADWDEASGTMGVPVELARRGEAQGRPDGAAVDRQGGYWSAGVSAGVLTRIGPDGAITARHLLPCRAPTMPAFGGVAGGLLFITSLVRPEWATPGLHDGALLQCRAPLAGCMSAVLRDG